MASISLHGGSFTPNDVQQTTAKIGKSLVYDNGGRDWMQRVDGLGQPIVKSQWEISWKLVDSTLRSAILAVFLLDTSFTFIDEHGDSYTVQCEDAGFKSQIGAVLMGAILLYDITLTIYEA